MTRTLLAATAVAALFVSALFSGAQAQELKLTTVSPDNPIGIDCGGETWKFDPSRTTNRSIRYYSQDHQIYCQGDRDPALLANLRREVAEATQMKQQAQQASRQEEARREEQASLKTPRSTWLLDMPGRADCLRVRGQAMIANKKMFARCYTAPRLGAEAIDWLEANSTAFSNRYSMWVQSYMNGSPDISKEEATAMLDTYIVDHLHYLDRSELVPGWLATHDPTMLDHILDAKVTSRH